MEIKKYKKDTKIHWSLLFSYWIYIWFLIYYFLFLCNIPLSKKIDINFNPLLALWLALFENIVSLCFLYFNNAKMIVLLKFILIMIFFKVIPIILLRNTKINIGNNFLVLILVFILYLCFLHIFGTHLFAIYHDAYEHILKNDDKTPFFGILNDFLHYFVH
jgi:hypothetical protein